MTFPFALYSDPWNIFTLVIDSMDFPSIGLMTLKQEHRKDTEAALKASGATLLLSLATNYTEYLTNHICAIHHCRKPLHKNVPEQSAHENCSLK